MEYQSPGERERRAAEANTAGTKQWQAEKARNYQETFDLIPQLVAAGYPNSSFIEKVVPVPPEQVGDWPQDHLYRLEYKPGIPRNVSKRKARRLAERPPIVTVWGITEVIRCWILLEARIVPGSGGYDRRAESPPRPRYSPITITEELTVPSETAVATETHGRYPSETDRFIRGRTEAYPREGFVPLSSVLSPEETHDVDKIRFLLSLALKS